MSRINMNSKNLLKKLKSEKKISFSEYKSLLEDTHNNLIEDLDTNKYNFYLSVICHVAESKPEDVLIKELLKECIYASRVFLYEDTLLKKYGGNYLENTTNSIFNDIAKEFYTLNTKTILTKDQKTLFNEFQKHKKIIVSAPTSFGKTRIIQEIILHNNFENIAIVLPTIALSNEIYLRLKGVEEIREKYNLVKTTNSYKENEKNILLLTPEKILILLEEKNPEIDFFVMDEIYKIDHEDDRRKVFSNCLYELAIKRKINRFYLLGPYFKKFSQKFLDKTNAKFLHFSSEIVQKDKFNHEDEKYKIKKVIEIINQNDEQVIVYFGYKKGVEDNCKKIFNQLNFSNIDIDFINYLEKNIHKDWNQINFLKKGAGFIHSGMPRYVQNEIIESFNKKNIKVLFTTTSITEGVNTTAKKLIILDDKKGRNNNKNPLTNFEVKNMIGRAGRFLEHFIGEVYILEKVNEDELPEIKFSYYDKENLEDLELTEAKNSDLKNKNLERRKNIDLNLKNNKIPIQFIRKNKYINYDKQISLINYFRDNIKLIEDLNFKGTFPKKETLNYIFNICENFLFTDKDKNRYSPFKGDQLRSLVNFYISDNCKNNMDLLNNNIIKNSSKNINTKIRHIFYFISHYCEFTLPKYFRAFENIYNFVIEEKTVNLTKINLSGVLKKLEFGTVEDHEICLKEVGLPNELIKKIGGYFKECTTLNQVNKRIKENKEIIDNCDNFEKRLLQRYL